MRRIIIILLIVVATALAIVILTPKRLANRPVEKGALIDIELVQLESPAPNSVVRSPLKVTGQAVGFWFFEASFPIRVLDADGNELGSHYVMTADEWMTTSMVPFEGVITFKASPTDTGYLVLHKDNPSGLPEHDREIRYPIRFR